jgi:ABC-type phosphate transport system substrate-binding protein
MRNETLSRILGAAVGAALIIAGMAVFGSGTITSAGSSSIQPVVSPVASLHASETVNVYSRN